MDSNTEKTSESPPNSGINEMIALMNRIVGSQSGTQCNAVERSKVLAPILKDRIETVQKSESTMLEADSLVHLSFMNALLDSKGVDSTVHENREAEHAMTKMVNNAIYSHKYELLAGLSIEVNVDESLIPGLWRVRFNLGRNDFESVCYRMKRTYLEETKDVVVLKIWIDDNKLNVESSTKKAKRERKQEQATRAKKQKRSAKKSDD